MEAVHEDIGLAIRVVDDGLSCVDIIEQSLKAVGREVSWSVLMMIDLSFARQTKFEVVMPWFLHFRIE